MKHGQFDAAEIEKLGCYVYLYTDPRNEQPFYVGKGKSNRAFAHLTEASEHEKVLRIKEIRASGLEPRIEVLAFGLDDETALKVEAAAIDLLGFDNLTNRVVGHGSRKYGRMSIDTVHAKLSATRLEKFEHNCVAIRVNTSVDKAAARLAQRFDGSSDESALALYDATRGSWRVSPDRVEEFEFAVAVHDGIVREVYRIAGWLPAGSTMYSDSNLTHEPTRYEFVGRVAEDSVRNLYRFKSVAHLFRPGDQNPVRYFRAEA